MVLITAAALLGFFAGAGLIALQQCNTNPGLCYSNGTYTTYPTYYYYWSYGPRVLVNTGTGQVKGCMWSSKMGRRFYAFLGIPYGEIPMRFESSRPFPPWDGTKDASMYGAMCLQLDRKTQIIMGSENCLFLNVFTPQINTQQLLPVMVWIDSSLGWQHGSGDKVNPRNFMNEHVVLVTFNFRQSSLGFLSTGDGEVQGNMGLKDQVLALTWVKQNIRNFGGDPDHITIFGQDSGAASVHFHMLSPLSNGLFHRAISQGGSAQCPWALQKNAGSKAKSLAQMLGCDTSTTKMMVDCMKFKTGQEIIEAEIRLKTHNWNGMEPYAMFGPTVEEFVYKSQPFLSDTPVNLIAKGQFMKVPWVVGMNEEEGRYFVSKILNSEMLTKEINSNWNRLSPISFLYDELKLKDGISSKIKSFYFGNKVIGKESWVNYTNAYTDRYYLSGIMDSIKAHSTSGQVYPYMFKLKGDFSYSSMTDGDYSFKHAPSHYDELYYLFNWEWATEPSSSSGMENVYLEFSKKLVKMWVSFAETGVPRGWGTTPEWMTMSPLNNFVNWYAIDYDTKTIVEDQFKTRADFWKTLGLQDEMNL